MDCMVFAEIKKKRGAEMTPTDLKKTPAKQTKNLSDSL